MKCCTKCKLEKPETEFHKEAAGLLARRSVCKTCDRVLQKKYRRAHPHAAKRHQLTNKFGITPEQYDEILYSQNGVCAICQNKCKSGRALAVDHVHGSGPVVIRGLLCMNCNNGLGRFQESPDKFIAALNYLQKRNPFTVPLIDSYESPC